ncbi:hypothetical protein [Chryseobacterium tongliaoense]
MKEMLKRIFMVVFILLVLTAISGFFYMQKHPMEKVSPMKSPVDQKSSK